MPGRDTWLQGLAGQRGACPVLTSVRPWAAAFPGSHPTLPLGRLA